MKKKISEKKYDINIMYKCINEKKDIYIFLSFIYYILLYIQFTHIRSLTSLSFLWLKKLYFHQLEWLWCALSLTLLGWGSLVFCIQTIKLLKFRVKLHKFTIELRAHKLKKINKNKYWPLGNEPEPHNSFHMKWVSSHKAVWVCAGLFHWHGQPWRAG